MQMNPDGYPERKDALEYLEERTQVAEAPEASPLLAALTTPV